MFAFVLIHFGSNIKYLELEIYFLIMLRKKTIHDIIYMYSINDTPEKFIDIIKKYCSRTIPFDDNNITYNIENFNSIYEHFNTLRTCNFMFAFTLEEYEKICIIESDMIIKSNIDKIFKLKEPAILYYNKNVTKIDKQYKIKYNRKDLLKICNKSVPINGGVLLFKPSLETFKDLKKNIKLIIKNNCKYPNEILFIYTMNRFYNFPIRYNFSHYYLGKNRYNIKSIKIYHFNESIYKPLNIIKDNWIEKEKNETKKEIILYFKKKYYDKYHSKIDKIINSFDAPTIVI